MGINYQEIAKCVAAASKDPKHRVGAVIFDKHGNIRSTGYNGAPRGVADSPQRYLKPDKQFYIVHAEANAIANAARMGQSIDGCIMLIYGHMPCANCVGLIIQAGLAGVIFKKTDITTSNWKNSFEAASKMLTEAGLRITNI